jgi:Sec-independent protein translocase protein TatA
MLIFVIALIVVGPDRLPEVGRSLGEVVNDVRQMSQEFTAPIMQEMNTPAKENEAKEIVDQSVSGKPASQPERIKVNG